MLLVQFLVASEDISGHPQPPGSCKCGGRQDEVPCLLVMSKTQFNMARRCSPHSHVEMGFGSQRWLWRGRVDDRYKTCDWVRPTSF